jgi:hypothetical protein
MLDRTSINNDLMRLPRWDGECVAIVASGASAKTAGVEALKDRIHVIAINTSVELCPWADMLYACDVNWWKLHRGAPNFNGLKVTQDIMAKTMFPDLIRISVPANSNDISDKFGTVGAGGNSAFQAMNMAVQMGATGIMLVGCDCGGEHWHGRHAGPCHNPQESNFIRWRKAFDGVKPKLDAMGVDVVNCSPISKIKAYSKLTIEQALRRWGL